MADTNIISMLASMLSPADAEAKITGTPEAMQLLQSLQTANAKAPKDAYLPQAYQLIYNKAEAVPETVSLRGVEGLMQMQPARAADYLSGKKEIRYDPSLSEKNLANPIHHELVHFLNSLLPEPYPADIQHRVIGEMLGTPGYAPVEQLQGFRARKVTPDTVDIWRQLLGLSPLSKR